MTELERRFNARMREVYELAKRHCSYNATRFLEMVFRPEGGLAAAKRLLRGPDVQFGLMALYHCGRLDISVEAAVVSDEFRELFTAEEVSIARDRLKALHYNP